MPQRRKPAPTSVRHEQVVVPVWAEAMITRLDTTMQRCQDLLTARSCKLIPVPAEVQSKPPVRAAIISKAPSSVIEVAAKPDLETGTFQSQGEEYDVTPPSPAEGQLTRAKDVTPPSPAEGKLTRATEIPPLKHAPRATEKPLLTSPATRATEKPQWKIDTRANGKSQDATRAKDKPLVKHVARATGKSQWKDATRAKGKRQQVKRFARATGKHPWKRVPRATRKTQLKRDTRAKEKSHLKRC